MLTRKRPSATLMIPKTHPIHLGRRKTMLLPVEYAQLEQDSARARYAAYWADDSGSSPVRPKPTPRRRMRVEVGSSSTTLLRAPAGLKPNGTVNMKHLEQR